MDSSLDILSASGDPERERAGESAEQQCKEGDAGGLSQTFADSIQLSIRMPDSAWGA